MTQTAYMRPRKSAIRYAELYDAWSQFWVPVATAAAVAATVAVAVAVNATVAIHYFTLLVHCCLTICPVTPYLTLKFVELPV